MHPAGKDDSVSNLGKCSEAQVPNSTRTNLEKPDQSGRLVVRDGRSRYVDDDASVIFGDKVGKLVSFEWFISGF